MGTHFIYPIANEDEKNELIPIHESALNLGFSPNP